MALTLSDGSVSRLLVVDDEAVSRLIVARAAATLGIISDGAATLAEAVAQVKSVAYDVVVLDLGLRDHDGIELLRSLRQSGSDPVVVFVSGFDERVRQAAARLAAALGLRVAGTLGKPLMVDRLVALLRALPERGRAGSAEDGADIDPALLEAAIEADEIICLFQPKVTLRERRLVGVEVLTRWRSPVLGLVRPDLFIPLAERAGLIDRLTERMMRQALALFRPWHAGRPELTLAINLSPVSLTDLSLPERISAALAESGVPAAALVRGRGCAQNVNDLEKVRMHGRFPAGDLHQIPVIIGSRTMLIDKALDHSMDICASAGAWQQRIRRS